MVFKPFTHLARQSFGKTLTHGYAQSVVAATQSSYASSTTPFGPFSTHAASKFSKHGSSQFHNTLQHPSGTIASGGQQGSVQETSREDGGLAAYYEAWQRQQRNHGSGKEWKQFQFPLRIGWNAQNALADSKGVDKDNALLRPDALLDRSNLDRAYSTSAVDDIKKAEDVIAEAAAVAEVDEAIAKEISSLQPSLPSSSLTPDVSARITPSGSGSSVVTPGQHQSNTTNPSPYSLPPTGVTLPTSQSPTLTDGISHLREAGRYAEIPVVFESILASGIQPSITDYNELLAAATASPAAQHHVVSKALNIYTDMLHRRITPDAAFYTVLLELLSRRAIEVYQTKAAMNIKRRRYGTSAPDSNFLLPSDESEYAILAADDALRHAIIIFDAASSSPQLKALSPDVYGLLVSACALHGYDEDMIRIHTHMEEHQVIPLASMFPPMIEAFARSEDLRTALRCYDGYRSLAIQHDAGEKVLMGRYDYSVYAAVIKSCMGCGRSEAGDRFITRILESFDNGTEEGRARLDFARDIIVTDGLIQHQIDVHRFAEALNLADTWNLTPGARDKALAHICSMAADHGDKATAIKAYQLVKATPANMSVTALSMMAMHIRYGELSEACNYWSVLYATPNERDSLIEPTTMYAIALMTNGQIGEGLTHARQAFARIRTSATTAAAREQIKEKIDEVIELFGNVLGLPQSRLSPHAAMNLLGAMTENNGLVSPMSEQLLAGLGAQEIATLSRQDTVLALTIEASMISNGAFLQDVAHVARFEHLLDVVTQLGLTLDEMTLENVERSLGQVESQRPGVIAKWRNARQVARPSPHAPLLGPPATSLAVNANLSHAATFDPYAGTTDHRGSNMILDVLEKAPSRRSVNLDKALSQFWNMRRIGRHPRYIVYSKLITVAALEGRANAIFDLLGTARQDVPLQSQYPLVREGWSSILDSMIGACLTVGNRAAASEFHQELLQLGSTPSANTFGLYITTLKESAQTLDEANEALDIFCRAKQEGAEPTSFLYNALIGKLGKARRIEDACFYFSEMQRRGLRPTSVTYGTMINALCRVSDERTAETLFDEMEHMSNYKPRPAPYNSVMQYFQTTKRDSRKVLEYYSRMLSNHIQPTMHTYKLLIDTYATLEPINMPAAEGVLDTIRASGQRPEAVHYASLIHAKGCVLHDLAGARMTFDAALANSEIRPYACLYQAMFESIVANHHVEGIEGTLEDMATRRVELTAYIANTVIHGWATAENISKAQNLYQRMGMAKREPSTYEAMTRAFLAVNDRQHAREVVEEMRSRGYPAPVTRKVQALLEHAHS
ncbi:MAG: hypothetical protein LQ345_002721 [Seirophora villosa]|nr:MAG: hypothetical protein LQ345_002721 [Seirophora villosa]